MKSRITRGRDKGKNQEEVNGEYNFHNIFVFTKLLTILNTPLNKCYLTQSTNKFWFFYVQYLFFLSFSSLTR